MGILANAGLRELGTMLIAFAAGILMGSNFDVISNPSVGIQVAACLALGFGLLYIAEKWGIELVKKALGR